MNIPMFHTNILYLIPSGTMYTMTVQHSPHGFEPIVVRHGQRDADVARARPHDERRRLRAREGGAQGDLRTSARAVRQRGGGGERCASGIRACQHGVGGVLVAASTNPVVISRTDTCRYVSIRIDSNRYESIRITISSSVSSRFPQLVGLRVSFLS